MTKGGQKLHIYGKKRAKIAYLWQKRAKIGRNRA